MSLPFNPVATFNVQRTANYDLMVIGDSRSNMQMFMGFIQVANHYKPQLLVHTGDIIDFSSPLAYKASREALSGLDKSITFLPVVGNHDVASTQLGITDGGLQLFNDSFGYESDFMGYQAVESGDKLIITLNSCIVNQVNSIVSEQLQWLKNTLKSNHLSEILIFMHHPMYPSGYHDPLENRDELHDLLKQYPVKAVYSGHEHLYYKEVVDGITYIVTGGGGSKLHDVGEGLVVHHMLGINKQELTPDVLDTGGNEIEQD